MTHICVGNLTIIVSDNGLSPGRRQAIIWTNAGILLIGLLATNFSEILIEIHSFSFKKMHLKMSSAKGRLFSLGLNELIEIIGFRFMWPLRALLCTPVNRLYSKAWDLAPRSPPVLHSSYSCPPFWSFPVAAKSDFGSHDICMHF